jgi:hypothetical protein
MHRLQYSARRRRPTLTREKTSQRLAFCVAGLALLASAGARAQPPAPGARASAPTVDEALAWAARGDLKPADLEASLARPATALPGLLSVYLASGGTLAEPALDAAARYPMEPRLHAMVAAAALDRGEPELAARWVFSGLQLTPRDAWLEQSADSLGWHIAPRAGPALAVPTDAVPAPAWPWVVAGLLSAALLAYSARQSGSRTTALALVAGVAAAMALPRGPPLPLPDLPSALVAPANFGDCERGPARLDDAAVVVPFRCAGETRVVRALKASAGAAYLRTPHHALEVAGHAPVAPALADAVAALAADLERAEVGGWRLSSALATPRAAPGWPRLSLQPPDARARLRLAVGAAAASLIILLAMATRALSRARAAAETHRQEAGVLLAILAGAALLHALAPGRMAMVYGGYDLVAHIASGVAPRYGPGAVAIYGPLLWVGGHDHAWLIAANRVLGLVALVLAWELGRVLWRQERGARIASALALATLPMLLRAHASESIVVPAAVLFLAALRLLVPGSTSGRVRQPDLAAAAVLLVTAALTRPDAAVLAAAVPLWAFAVRGGLPALPRAQVGRALVAAGLLIGFYAIDLAATAQSLADQDSLTTWGDLVGQTLGALTGYGALGDPIFTPLGLWPLILLGIYWQKERRPALATLALALAWLAVTSVDLARVSIPRLHEPTVLLVLPLAATGLVALLARARASAASQAARVAPALVALAWVGSCGYQTWAHFRPTLSDAEDALWRDGIALLPPGDGCLFAMGFGDPPDPRYTARYNPGYLLAAQRPGWRLLNLSDLARPPVTCEGHRAVLLGTRCYGQVRNPDDPVPAVAQPFPVCEAARAAAGRPLMERRVPTTDALSLPMYPASGDLSLGVYDVPAASRTAPPAPTAPRPR